MGGSNRRRDSTGGRGVEEKYILRGVILQSFGGWVPFNQC